MKIKRLLYAVAGCTCLTAVLLVMTAQPTQAQYGYGGYYGGYNGAYGRPAGYGLYPPYRGAHFSFSIGRSPSYYQGYPSAYRSYSPRVHRGYYQPVYSPGYRLDFDDDDDDGYRHAPRYHHYYHDDDDD